MRESGGGAIHPLEMGAGKAIVEEPDERPGAIGFRGHGSVAYFNVAKLTKGRVVSVGHFEFNKSDGYASIARTYRSGPWTRPTAGFVGFRLDNGSGPQYGWARVKLSGAPNYKFQLVDYAWADPGEKLQTGQMKSRSRAEVTSKFGSLGLLAAGGSGLKAWRAEKTTALSLLVR